MSVIYKYELDRAHRQSLKLPIDAEILSVQMQAGNICAWVKLDPNKPTASREIMLVGTGHSFDDRPMRHISTIQDNGFVWHFFESV